MAEIKVPQKRSFINTPVGVAKTDAGEARAAQQIANASRTLSNATFNTASQIMNAGSELQQNFEQRKFTDWASQVPIVTESGEYATYEMPRYISGKTRNQIEQILQNRYKVDSEVRLRNFMVQKRAEYKNDEEKFSTAVSNFIKDTQQKISAAGGVKFAQDFADIGIQLQSQHINDIRKNLSEASDAVALSKKQTDLDQKASIVYNQFANNNPNAQESLDALLQEIDELPQSYKVGPEFLINTKAVILSDVARTQIITAGFSDLPDDQRQIVMAEIQSGVLDQSFKFLPILQELMAPDGLLNTTTNRERVFRDLSATDQKLRLASNFAQQQNALRNMVAFGTGDKHQKSFELNLQERFGIQIANPMDLASAAENNSDVADALEAHHVLPFSLINTLKAQQTNLPKINQLPDLFRLVDVTKNALFDLTGDRTSTTDKGLDAETMAFVLAVDGIRNSYPDADSQLEAITRLTGNIQERDALGRKFAEADLIRETTDYTNRTSLGLAKDALFAKEEFNPEFVEKFGGVYARLASAVPLATADRVFKQIYNTYYKEYEHAYVPNDGYEQQAFMPNSYYDGVPLLRFKGASVNMMKKLSKEANNAIRYEMGRTAFLRPNPMNTREYGQWVFVNEQGQPIRNTVGELVTIDTNAIDAETVLEQRMRMNQEELEKAIKISESRIANKPSLEVGRRFAQGM